MNHFSLHPNVYATSPRIDSLLRILEKIWVHDHRHKVGQGTIYIISGFGMYNGGVRFFDELKNHVRQGGRVVCFFAGSTSQRLTSKQLATALLNAGAEVNIVNRKRLLHAKCYGVSYGQPEDTLVVTSGNFTSPGLSYNGEAAVLLDDATTQSMGFSWQDLETNLKAQVWDRRILTANPGDPTWQLLYDEQARGVTLDVSEQVTLLVTLVHNDTSRIVAQRVGSQYFFLSVECSGFFPPLTIRNRIGTKSTFSCLVNVHYIPIQKSRQERVTFEMDNNLDFRLGTGLLRNTNTASPGDLAAISRTAEDQYELRIIRQADPLFLQLRPYVVNNIGNRGKQYGFIDNDDFTQITGVRLPSVPRGGFP